MPARKDLGIDGEGIDQIISADYVFKGNGGWQTFGQRGRLVDDLIKNKAFRSVCLTVVEEEAPHRRQNQRNKYGREQKLCSE